ncbi:hypothetical protein K504DRAFT_465036 [Pleomassaria siparia CBS 279.74]|uniref:Zn(2)-C6 fungal-type domain-containing protein n=1 Tax=Pleomassaria siparia CBS 279.74 TaxID=1314801 RepID=A0A6G1KEE5_9PLEO|nr:hypothetical protein K504DRAFT_465036 [Pleomassaria siparia CBS 279.74]
MTEQTSSLAPGHQTADNPFDNLFPIANRPTSLRTACDYCHQAKVRCTGGGSVCGRCQRDNIPCHYSYPARVGKPKGSRNKKTIEKLNALARQTRVESPRSQGDQFNQPFGHVRPQIATNIARLQQFREDGQCSSSPHSMHTQYLVRHDSTGQPGPDPFLNFTDMDVQGNKTSSLQQSEQRDSVDSILACQFSSSECLPTFQSIFPEDEVEINDLVLSPTMEAAGHPTPHSSDSFASNPPSSRPENTMHLSLRMSTAELEETFGFSEPQGCDCLQRQANHLCQLRKLERRSGEMRLDNLMRFSSTVFQTLEQSQKCTSCINDAQVLQIGGMIFRVLLRWIAATCQGSEYINVQLGDYSLTDDDNAWMNILILSRLLSNCKTSAELFKRRIELTFSSTNSRSLDQTYLTSVASGLVSAFDEYITQVAGRKANTEMFGGRKPRPGSATDRFF